jgi:p-hydroxybenzoate 3-monooxygenase
MAKLRTKVGIIGAGPAGLTLAHLLYLQGIESVVLERQSREGLQHHGVELRFDGEGHRVDFQDLVGKSITVYAQQEVLKDLIAARIAANAPLFFEAEALGVAGFDENPKISYRHGGSDYELRCDFIAGCDGFHGICRPAVPSQQIRVYERHYPFAWLGILARVAPASHELIYTYHERGFALLSMRSPEISRLYLQCHPEEDIAHWPDERIWEEFRARMATRDGFVLKDGPILQKGVTPMRSFVAEPMQFGNLFLLGDAAHIVPPTGAKGLNLAVADVRVLTRGLVDYYKRGTREALQQYTERCLRRVWKTQRFSWWMTAMLHRFPNEDRFAHQLHHAELDYVTSSRAASATLAENYVGLPFDSPGLF